MDSERVEASASLLRRGGDPAPRAERRRGAPPAPAPAGASREQRLIDWLESRSLRSVQLGALVLLALIGWVDYATGPEIGLSLFYLLPLAVVAWRCGSPSALGLAVLGAVAWYLAEAHGGRRYVNPLAPYWNALVRLAIFGTVTSLIGVIRRLVAHERDLARTDAGTGLPNARRFYQEADRLLRSLPLHSRPLTIAYIDVDDFKQVNDRLGHAAGDEVLRGIGGVLGKGVRSTDLAARLGGDEFALLLPETDRDGATEALLRLKQQLDALARDNDWPISFSFGAVTTSTAGRVDDLVGQADALMYEVKRSGKNGFRHVDLSSPGLPAARGGA